MDQRVQNQVTASNSLLVGLIGLLLFGLTRRSSALRSYETAALWSYAMAALWSYAPHCKTTISALPSWHFFVHDQTLLTAFSYVAMKGECGGLRCSYCNEKRGALTALQPCARGTWIRQIRLCHRVVLFTIRLP